MLLSGTRQVNDTGSSLVTAAATDGQQLAPAGDYSVGRSILTKASLHNYSKVTRVRTYQTSSQRDPGLFIIQGTEFGEMNYYTIVGRLNILRSAREGGCWEKV